MLASKVDIRASIQENKILVILSLMIVLGVIAFDIFHYSKAYGIVQINLVNSLLLVPFIVLVCGLGMLLGTTKQKDEFEYSFLKRFSKRELEVVALINQGKRNQEIAEELYIDLSTVKSHLNKIYRKTGVKSRKELMEMAFSSPEAAKT